MRVMRKLIRENKKNADCAIVGAYNASVYMYGRANYRKIESLAKKKYSYSSKDGFDPNSVQDFLNDLGLRTTNFFGLNIQYAEKEILNGRPALATIRHVNDKDSHVVFLVPKDRSIEIVNSSYTWIELVEDFLKGNVKLSIWAVHYP